MESFYSNFRPSPELLYSLFQDLNSCVRLCLLLYYQILFLINHFYFLRFNMSHAIFSFKTGLDSQQVLTRVNLLICWTPIIWEGLMAQQRSRGPWSNIIRHNCKLTIIIIILDNYSLVWRFINHLEQHNERVSFCLRCLFSGKTNWPTLQYFLDTKVTYTSLNWLIK